MVNEGCCVCGKDFYPRMRKYWRLFSTLSQLTFKNLIIKDSDNTKIDEVYYTQVMP